MYLFATCLHINKCTHIVTWTHFFGKAYQMVFLFNTLVKNINISFQLSDQEVTKLSFLLRSSIVLFNLAGEHNHDGNLELRYNLTV